VLVSWNFRHIVNLNKIHLYNGVNLKKGYPLLEIRSPREVVYEKEI
ncbi:MAG: PIN domain protein, partial [bacterium]